LTNVLKLEYDKYVESNDTINRKKIAVKLNKILQVDRIDLLKRYVSINSTSKVGALLPAFCTIENSLTEKDYEEIYNTFSENIKQTDYGQRIFEKFQKPKE